MKALILVLATACALQACGAPSGPGGGPTLPNGAHSLSLKELSLFGPYDVGPDVMASTSLAEVRDGVIAHANLAQYCATNASAVDSCWSRLPEEPGRVYIAVVTNPWCTNPVKEVTALGGHTLYFIQWIGNPQGVCNMALARPMWRLYSVSRTQLPASGTLTVRLELQGNGTGAAESQVSLT